MNHCIKFAVFGLVFLCTLFALPALNWAADGSKTTLVVTTAQRGDDVTEAVLGFERITALAGIKAVMTYNDKDFIYQKMEKSTTAASLLSVVNDKVPGRLVVVMAGAQGISGTQLELLTLTFSRAGEGKGTGPLNLTVTSVEMLTDQLQPIEAHIEYRTPQQ